MVKNYIASKEFEYNNTVYKAGDTVADPTLRQLETGLVVRFDEEPSKPVKNNKKVKKPVDNAKEPINDKETDDLEILTDNTSSVEFEEYKE